MNKLKTYAFFSCLLILISAFVTIHKQKLSHLLEHSKKVFTDIAPNGKPSTKACYNNKGEIIGLRQAVANMRVGRLKNDEKISFLITAHNIEVLHQINTLYPINNIENYHDFFERDTFNINRNEYTLKSLRNDIFNLTKDPRVYFCLYTGGLSSPDLYTDAFSSEYYTKSIQEITINYINNNSKIKVKERSKLVLLPEFMLWYKSDFGIKNDHEYINWLNNYRLKENIIPSNYTVSYYPYSWKLYK